MAAAEVLRLAVQQGWSDEEVVARVVSGETGLFEILMRRHNQRLYRAARAILRDDAEAEDVMQDAYVRAFQHLSSFAGKARFSTWLTRIAVNEALARVERRGRQDELEMYTNEDGELRVPQQQLCSPEQAALQQEVRGLLESVIMDLPASYRAVLVLRDVEEMSTEETAAVLDLSEENVKTRLHRARATLRKALYDRAGASSSAAFQFPAQRCDQVVREVFCRVGLGER